MSHGPDRDPERWLVEQARRGEPSPERLPSIYQRVQASLSPRPPAGAGAIPRALVTVGVAALTLVGVWWLRNANRALDLPLEAQQPTSTTLLPELDAHYQGSGHVLGTARHPRITWSLGRLDLALEPGAGVDLEVVTSEVEVRVTGTHLSVERDARGTRVEVQEGHVTVGCLGSGPPEPSAPLLAGQERWCLPSGPSGLLGRARRLQQLGDLVEAEEAVERGLSIMTEPSPPRGELLVLAMELRLGRGDKPAALVAASAYLREGYPARAQEVRAVHDTLAAARRLEGSQP